MYLKRKRAVNKVIGRLVKSYEASGDFELICGKILSRQLGITDAPKELFDAVTEDAEQEFDRELTEVIRDPEEYPTLQSLLQKHLKDQGIIG